MKTCVVIAKFVALEIAIPMEVFGEFILLFGAKFAQKDTSEGTESMRKVDDYYELSGCMRVRVSVWQEDEEKLRTFLKWFSKDHGLELKESE